MLPRSGCPLAFALLVLLGAVLVPVCAGAAPGSLDTSFGLPGRMVTPINLADQGNAVAIDSSGRIVVAGSALSGADWNFAAVRYTAGGSPDATFDFGSVQTQIGPGNEYGQAVAIDTSGRVVVAGFSWDGTKNNVAVVRYTTTGSLDTSFDGDGKVTTPIGTADDEGNAVATDGSGRIVVAGYSWDGTRNNVAVVRYTTTGALDTTFSGDGKATTSIGASHSYGYAVTIDGSGRVVVAGYASNSPSDTDVAVVRYTGTGNLDTSFDGDGKVTTSIGSGGDFGRAVAIDGSGRIVVAGYSWSGPGNNDIAVVRYTASGILDTAFDGDGIVTTPIGAQDDYGLAMVIDGSGRIVVAGHSYNGTDLDFALVRYGASGGLDTTFGLTGKMTTAFGDGRGMAIDGSGRIVVAGYSYVDPIGQQFAMVRYTASGSLDTTFDGDGKVTTPIGTGQSQGHAMAIDGNGRIVVAGSAFNAGSDLAVARYTASGSLDATFSGDGIVTTPIGTGYDFGYAVAIDGSGRIVVAGSTEVGSYPNNSYHIAVVRYTASGGLDPTFSGDGKVTTPIGAVNSVGHAVAIDGSGRIVVAGYSDSISDREFVVVRYTASGNLDTSFDGDGIVTTAIGPYDDPSFAMAIDGSGRIVVAGSSNTGAAGYDIALVRYTASGSLDATFGGGGKVTTHIASTNYAYAVAIDGSGRIVVAGFASSNPSGNEEFAVVRYTTTGALDTTFSGDGIVTTPIGAFAFGSAVAIDGSGRIVVGGTSDGNFAVVRYLGGSGCQ